MPIGCFGHAARAHRGIELVEVADADAGHEPARVGIVLGREEELQHDPAALEDQPAAVAVGSLEPERRVERDRRVEVA